MSVFRPITKEDLVEVVGMMAGFYAIDGYPIDTERSKELFEKFIDSPDLGRCWVISDDGQTAGYLILTFVFSFEYGGTIAFVDELYIKGAFRGKGLGRAAIEFAKEEAARLGLKLLYLEVEPHNVNAQRLYQNAGFTTHKRAMMRYQPD